MQVTFKASPKLLKVSEIGESIVEEDEALRKQLTNFVLAAIYDQHIPLRTNAGFKASKEAMGDVESFSRQVSKDKAKEELIKFETRIKAEAMKAFAEDVDRRAADRRAELEGGMQAIAQPPERLILNPEAIMQSPLWMDVRREHINLLKERERHEARDWTREYLRGGFVLLSEVVDWLRKEQGFDVAIVEASIPTDGELAGLLAKWFDKPVGVIPQRLREIVEAYIPKWPELSGADRQARANEVDRQLATKRALKIKRADREQEQAKNDPMQVAQGIVAWYDMTLNVRTWWSLSSVTPREAAMLLCRLDPHDDTLSPLSVTTDETSPDDFKRLLRVFEDVAHAQPRDRRLNEWHDIAHDRELKYHSWIVAYRQALTKSGHMVDGAISEEADKKNAQLRPEEATINLPPGAPSAEILQKFRLDESWRERLGKPDRYKYLLPALAQRGVRGGGAHRWNPAIIGAVLIQRGERNRVAVSTVIERQFPKWIDEWERIFGVAK